MASSYRQPAAGASGRYGDLQGDNFHVADTNLPPPHRPSGPYDPYAQPSPAGGTPPALDKEATALSFKDPPDMSHNRGYSNLEAPYSNQAYSSSQWLEKQQSQSKKSKYIVIGSLVALIVLIGVGVGVGVTLANKSHSSDAADGNTGGGGGGNGSSLTNPNDPSSFTLDPALHNVFYGLSYTPAGSQLPECGNSISEVIQDIQLISQLTNRIHLYGADCNQTALVLDAIQQTKTNISVYVANYNVPTNATPYIQQRDDIIDALQTYGTDNILGVLVGNEFILDYLDANGGTVPNSLIGDQGAQLLVSNITDMRQTLASNGFGSIPVGTADAGAYFNLEVLQNVDFAMSNVHPWFANVSIEQAAGWTYEFFEESNIALTQNMTTPPKWFIGETGWPSNSTNIQNESNGPSNASTANLQTFLDTFVCASNENGTGYFYFEFMDETWQAIEFGGVEGSWGLFYPNRTLKPITIPTCS